MDFEWDSDKSAWKQTVRGFDFDFVTEIFADARRIDRTDTRRHYGEPRRQTIGEIEGTIYFAAYTFRGSSIRIISARRAHDKEEKEYRDPARQAPSH